MIRASGVAPLALCALMAVTGSQALAQDAPEKPRAVTFKDGRTYIGEIVTTEPGGMRMRIPQGETVVGFYAFRGVKASDASAWRRQGPWEVIVVGPDTARRWVEASVRTYPSVLVSGDEGLSRPMNLGARAKAKDCPPRDLACVEQATARDGGWSWIVTVEPDSSDGSATLRGGLSTGDETARKRVKIADFTDPDALLTGLDELMGLDNVPGRNQAAARLASIAPKSVKEKPSKPVKEPKEKPVKEPKEKPVKEPKEKPVKEPKVKEPRAKSEGLGLDVLVPLPGYPSLKRGDTASFGMAVAVAAPATVVWVAATGNESQSIPEHALLSAGGYYVTTVFLSHLMGRRTLNNAPQVSVAPREGHGATVRIDGRF